MRARGPLRLLGAAFAVIIAAAPFFACNGLTHIGDYQVDCLGCIEEFCPDPYAACVVDPVCSAGSLCFQQCAAGGGSIETCNARCAGDAGPDQHARDMLACIARRCVPYCFTGNPGPADDSAVPSDTPAAETGTDSANGDSSCDTNAAVAVDPADCNSERGPKMTQIHVNVDGGSQNFCIDQTEVTFAQYQAFLDDRKGSTCGQIDECAWNTSFAWKVPPPDAATIDTYPVYGIDWCDAYAYCQWAGKHLCGALDGNPSTTTAALTDGWTYVCSDAVTNRYPYGSTYDSSKCQTEAISVAPVKSKTLCHGPSPFDTVFDMSGNVSEWEDFCTGTTDAGPAALCATRGGSFRTPSPDTSDSCDANAPAPRNTTQDDIGFRCCAP